MLMKKFLAAVLASAMVVSSCVACSSNGGSSSAAPASSAATSTASVASTTGGKKVGISMPTKSLERWNRDGSYLEKQFKGKGCDVKVTYSDNKIDQQVKDIENLIADKVNLLVVAAIDGESLSNVLNTAKSANIPVISYDRLIMNTDAISYYVSFDNYKVGQLQGQFVVDKLGLKKDDKSKSYNIEFTAGDPADNNATFFFNGAYDTLKDYIDAGILKIPSKQTKFQQVATQAWDTKNAMNRMQNILGSYYSGGTKLDVALCSNDSTALGVAQAIGTDYKGGNTPIITGQDGDEANLKNIVDGKQSMTVYKAVANEAVATLDIGMAILDGKKPDESLIKSAGWKFDCAYDTKSYNNKKLTVPSYLLVPNVVTKDTIQKDLVDTGYYTMDGKYPKAKK
ncbi:MAG TPA: sugar-binding protein [Oscillospiraceae bacterium]|nr:sugar-binding protein [Oscillospiraceae bacterium]